MTASPAMTPLTLSLLVHTCTCEGPHPNRGMPAVEDAIRQLIRLGAVAHAAQSNCLTPSKLGQAWLAALCTVAPPRRAWIDSQGAVVAIEGDV